MPVEEEQSSSVKKRICVAAVNVPPWYGGAGRAAARYAAYFANEQEDVLLITDTPHPDPVPNVEVASIPYPGWLRKLRIPKYQILYAPVILFKLLRLLDSGQIGVVHCKSGAWFSLLVLTAARLKGVTSIIETSLLDSDDPMAIRRQQFGSIKLRMYKQAAAVVNVSPALLNQCDEAGIDTEKSLVIPYSVDVQKFTPPNPEEKKKLREQLSLSQFESVLLTVGIVRPRKNTADIVEIFRAVADRLPNSCLVIVGPTKKNQENIEYTAKIRDLIQSYGLQDRIRLAGSVPNVHEWMQASDAFLFASDKEGLANVYLESISSGLPVIAKKIDGITDYIFQDGENGFQWTDIPMAAEQIAQLFSDKQLWEKISKNARQTALNKFSQEVVMQSFKDLYQKVGFSTS